MPTQSLLLKSNRLLLAPLQESDRHLYHQLYSDAKVMRNIAEPFSAEQIDNLFDKNTEALNASEPRVIVWGIKQAIDLQSIGIIALYDIRQSTTDCKIGLMLLRQANGKLYPEEVMACVIDFAFDKLGLNRIVAEFKPTNLATKRFVKKLGFAPIDAPSSACELLHYALVHSIWASSPI